MIIAENIHKHYDDLEVLKGVDLHIKKSEVVSIVGSSGAGKTTLLQILGSLDTAFIKGLDKKEAEEKAKKLLDFLGLSHRYNHKPDAMSGGEQQRVAVARALINDPKVVFADEPSGNLDSESAENLHQLFFNLRDTFGQTFVIVTHNKEFANMADRKLVMRDGNLIDNPKIGVE